MAEDDLELQIPDKLYFRIGELSGLVGVEPHVLRYWEQEFRIRPQRSPSGQRMYRRRDIARFLQIKSLLHKRGFTISGARQALADARVGDKAAITPDLEQLRAARERMEDVREGVERLRRRVSQAWAAHLTNGSTSAG